MTLLFSSFQGVAAHVPQTVSSTLEILEEHAHDHGHAHREAVDLFWLAHGHSHDLADHDHHQALLLPGPYTQSTDLRRLMQRIGAAQAPLDPVYALKRPPRL